MGDTKGPRNTFPLRLAASLRDRAEKLAAIDGVSINHFITLALAEKISRLEAESHAQAPPVKKERED